MKCPHCHANTKLFKSDGHVVKMRAPILVFSEDGNRCIVPCPKCHKEIQVPVTLAKSDVADTPRLVLAQRRLTRSKGDP